ncbi:MAG: acetate kinase [Hyphomicrobiales bacterium]|nr:acetate kinase [Hyphomicrobiales bacterium]
MTPVLVVLNSGSSSLKFQVLEAGREPACLFKGLFEGFPVNARLTIKDPTGAVVEEARWGGGVKFGHENALMHLVSWLRAHQEGRVLRAIGHRVVHGGEAYGGPVLVDDDVLRELDKLSPLAPLHQPHNLEPIRIVRRRLPDMPQVACFDTAFHRTQPEIATMFALPRDIRERGVRRFGFHGLSYEYIASGLRALHPRLADGKVIVAHLGNGASLCALKAGVSVATTMGFSALDGLPMGTRCGAIDPGAIFYMLREMKLKPEEAERILYNKSGLLGVSGLSNDMRTLRASAAGNAQARCAIDLFVYRIVREAGSLISALGGLDGFVFTGGIGENDPATRAETTAGMSWIGMRLDEAANRAGRPLISSGDGPTILVMPTNEESIIAQQTLSALQTAT